MFPKPPDPEALTVSFVEMIYRSLSSGAWNGLAFLLAAVALVVQFAPRAKVRHDFESWSAVALSASSLWIRMVAETWIRLAVFALGIGLALTLIEWVWHAVTGQYLNEGAEELIDGLVVTRFSITRHVVSSFVLLALLLGIVLIPAAVLRSHLINITCTLYKVYNDYGWTSPTSNGTSSKPSFHPIQ